jgi:predicted HTH transcriptional regulator
LSLTVAFSNADGGVMLIGVRDDGSIAACALDAGT